MSDDDFEEFSEVFIRQIRVSKRYIRDMDDIMDKYTESDFKYRFRFSKDVVLNVVLPIVSQKVLSSDRGLPVSPLLKLLTALRFYATSSFQVRFKNNHSRNHSK